MQVKGTDLHEVPSSDCLADIAVVVFGPEICAFHFHPHARADTHLHHGRIAALGLRSDVQGVCTGTQNNILYWTQLCLMVNIRSRTRDPCSRQQHAVLQRRAARLIQWCLLGDCLDQKGVNMLIDAVQDCILSLLALLFIQMHRCTYCWQQAQLLCQCQRAN